MVAIVAVRWLRRGGAFGETPTTFGSSQWATERKIKRMDLLGPRGMPWVGPSQRTRLALSPA